MFPPECRIEKNLLRSRDHIPEHPPLPPIRGMWGSGDLRLGARPVARVLGAFKLTKSTREILDAATLLEATSSTHRRQSLSERYAVVRPHPGGQKWQRLRRDFGRPIVADICHGRWRCRLGLGKLPCRYKGHDVGR